MKTWLVHLLVWAVCLYIPAYVMSLFPGSTQREQITASVAFGPLIVLAIQTFVRRRRTQAP